MYIPKKRFWLVIASVSLILISSIVSNMSFSRYEVSQNASLTAPLGDMIYSFTKLPNNNSNIVYQLDAMKPGDTKEYNFSVLNNTGTATAQSKVPFNYTITIETYGNLPLTIKLENTGLPSGSGVACPTTTASYSSSKPNLSLTATGTMYVNNYHTHTYKVTVTWPSANKTSTYSDEVECLIVKTSVGQLQPSYS